VKGIPIIDNTFSLTSVTKAPVSGGSAYDLFATSSKPGSPAAGDVFYFYVNKVYAAILVESVTESSITFWVKESAKPDDPTLSVYLDGNAP